MWNILEEIVVLNKVINIIKALYGNSGVPVKVEGQYSTTFSSEKGVRQGCILCPTLLNINEECIIGNAVENWQSTLSMDGTNVPNLSNADDAMF